MSSPISGTVKSPFDKLSDDVIYLIFEHYETLLEPAEAMQRFKGTVILGQL